jgi:hypothetical protein
MPTQSKGNRTEKSPLFNALSAWSKALASMWSLGKPPFAEPDLDPRLDLCFDFATVESLPEEREEESFVVFMETEGQTVLDVSHRERQNIKIERQRETQVIG